MRVMSLFPRDEKILPRVGLCPNPTSPHPPHKKHPTASIPHQNNIY